MLGEALGEEIGQITGTRVLSIGPSGPEMEVSFQADGTVLGVHATDMGTYTAVTRADGNLYGEGRGALMTQDGELVTWKGQGVGRFLGRGTAIAWRGAVYYETTSKKLSRLNGIAAVYEFEVDEGGKTSSKIFEWK